MRKLLIMLTIIGLLLTGCSRFEPVVIQLTKVLQLQQEIDPLDLVKVTEPEGAQISIIENNLDTSSPGSYTVTYQISYHNRTVNQMFTFEVADQDPPVIAMESEIQITKGTNFDLLAYAAASDRQDGDVSASLHYEGTINVNEEGDYLIQVYANDRYGNEAVMEVLVVIVDDYQQPVKPTIVGLYQDVSYQQGIPITLNLLEDGSFELYLNECAYTNLIRGQYRAYMDHVYLISDEHQFSPIAEENLLCFQIETNGSLTLISETSLCAPSYGDNFKKQ